jgi:phage repressor protein C with HTH and peptisase S24 domain
MLTDHSFDRAGFSERLKQLQGDMSERAFATKVGINPTSVSNYLNGQTPGVDKVVDIATACGVSVSWLITGADSPPSQLQSTAMPEGFLPASVMKDFALIPRLDIRASAGNGNLAIDEEVIDFLAFQESWLRGRNINPKYARVMTAKGDSMEPTIRDGDVLLVDTSIDRIRDNSLYVLVFGGMVFVKRIHQRLTGAVLLISDNTHYPPEEVSEANAPDLHVAGRVVWFGRSI